MKTDMRVITVPDFVVFLKQFENAETFTATDLQYKTFITYSHLLKIRNALENIGLISTERKGRQINISITEKGKTAVVASRKFLDSLDINDENLQEFRAKTKTKHKHALQESSKFVTPVEEDESDIDGVTKESEDYDDFDKKEEELNKAVEDLNSLEEVDMEVDDNLEIEEVDEDVDSNQGVSLGDGSHPREP